MAKKSRKVRAAARPAAAVQRSAANQPQANGQAPAQRASKQAAPATVNIMQPGYYDYVKKDLVTIGIISAALIVILIILTFIPALNS